jgi:predicted Rossmann-fold nucleotide-binding protein
MHAKPCGLLDVDGYYAPLVQFLDGAVASRLLKPEHRALLLHDDDPIRLVEAMGTWTAPRVTKWIDRRDS